MINHQPKRAARILKLNATFAAVTFIVISLISAFSPTAFAVLGKGTTIDSDSDSPTQGSNGTDPSIRVILTKFRGAHELTVNSIMSLHVTRDHDSSNINSDMSVDPQSNLNVKAPESKQHSSDDETVISPISSNSIVLDSGESIRVTPSNIENADDGGIGLSMSGVPGRHYRGEIDITAQPDGTLQVTNVIGVEEYLLGVVGPEIGPGAPLEAVEAQAVAARTYALKNRGKYAKLNADIDDSTSCQNYGGIDSECKTGTIAVTDTAGQVVSYNGALIDALYATDCGGETADGGLPYLSPVSDPECVQSSAWTLSLPIADFLTALSSIKGLTVPEGIDQISILKTDLSGRVLQIQLMNSVSGQTCIVTSNQLRVALGVDKLRSTLFTVSIDKTAENCVFTGKGWGHGLGMCQHGAIDMAKAGATYQQILAHYYTGTQLAQVDNSLLVAAAPVMKVLIRTVTPVSNPIYLTPAANLKTKPVSDYQPSVMLHPKPAISDLNLPTWPAHDL